MILNLEIYPPPVIRFLKRASLPSGLPGCPLAQKGRFPNKMFSGFELSPHAGQPDNLHYRQQSAEDRGTLLFRRGVEYHRSRFR